MPPNEWVDDDNAALLTDLYQLTMLQAYYREGMNDEAVFDLFTRRIRHRNFLLAAGLDTVLHYLETFHFTSSALEYLESLKLFKPDFLSYLEAFRFTGDVYAVPEGTPVFPNEPILQVVAPLQQAQLIESFLLNQITFQTGMASKAVRVVQAARGRTVVDFGMRRMHGADAALKAVRAYHIAGLHATSNVLAGATYGLPVMGTMAHSYIEAHTHEADAFTAFVRSYPRTTLLVDTYGTLQGIRQVIRLHQERGIAFQIQAVRLDSGDLAALSKQARSLLDEAGLHHIRLFASGSLDEYAITKLLDQGAPIDGFGVGTRMGTMADQPYLDTAYKLCSYAGHPRMKLSAEKSNLPGRKQVFRVVEDGKAVHDIIALEEEKLEGTPLLHGVMQQGKRTHSGQQTLEDARQQAQKELATLPSSLLRLEAPTPPYPVQISEKLQAHTESTRQSLLKRIECL